MKKNIVILGSTGSIGTETFNLIKNDKKKFTVKLLSTNRNIKKIYYQAKLLNVKNIIISDINSFNKAKQIYKNSKIKFYNSFSVIDQLFKKKDIYYSMVSIVGLDGLEPTLKLIKYSKNIAIINKESLVCAWNMIHNKLKKYNTNFFPLDSEHFSIFQLLDNKSYQNIEKVYITASGGPFLNYNNIQLSNITITQALKHPNWKMGNKISIDSSTMMNKLFEVIEAKKIFNLSYNDIDILIHPKSYVHAMIKFNTGMTKLLIHEPNMKVPIYNSIYFDDKKILKTNDINFKILNNLEFKKVDYKKFYLIRLLSLIPEKESLFETVLITINDYFVSIYLKKKINYIKLLYLINLYARKKIFSRFKAIAPKNIHDIYQTKNYVNEILANSVI